MKWIAEGRGRRGTPDEHVRVDVNVWGRVCSVGEGGIGAE